MTIRYMYETRPFKEPVPRVLNAKRKKMIQGWHLCTLVHYSPSLAFKYGIPFPQLEFVFSFSINMRSKIRPLHSRLRVVPFLTA